MGRLNQKDIDRAGKKRRYSDGRGLFLSINKGGSKTWVFQYRFPDASRATGYREKELSLGSIDFLSLEQARNKLGELRELVRAGIDPMVERNRGKRAVVRRTRDGTSFKEVAERLIETKAPEWDVGGKSEASWRGSLSNHVFPHIGAIDIADLDTPDIRDVLKPIWLTSPVTAQRLLPRIEQVFDYAAAEGFRTGDNPADRHKVKKLLPSTAKIHKVKKHDALPFADIPSFMADLRAETAGSAPRALELLILTATRTSEVTEAVWDEIDLADATWTIPASRMKADKEHRIPLSPAAITLLESLKVEEGNPFVFISPVKKGAGLSNMAMTVLLKRMGRKEGVTVHGFRSTFRDWVSEETSYPGEVAEMALAHSIKSKVEASYRRGDLFEKRKPLMADWAAYCDASRSGGNVVSIRATGQ